MERLKAILADKILDLTSSGSDDVKTKIDKMHRFRDFANACQTLMIKYPQIEDELIKMVNDGDFDTKVASSRVDSVIRMADQTAQPSVQSNTVEEKEPAEKLISEESDISNLPVADETEDIQYQPEDIEYEEIAPSSDDDAEKGYVPYEEVNNNETIVEMETTLSEKELAAKARKTTIKRVIQIVAALAAVALIIIIIKFVMEYWQTILIILGVALLILIVVWFLTRKKKK